MAPAQERSVSANAVLSAFGWAVPAIAALIAVPITVRGLGADQYGLLALTVALTGYLGLMEMGLGNAIMRYLSFYRALDQGRPMVAILWFALRWYCAVGVIGAVFLWFAAPWLVSAVLRVPEALQPTGVTVLQITGVNFLLAIIVSIGTAIPQSFLRYDIASALSGFIGTLAAIGPAIVVTLGYGLVAIVWFSVFLNLAAIVIYGIIGSRLMGRVPRSVGPSWKEIRRQTLSFAGLAALKQIGGTLSQQTSQLVVGIASGVAAAGYYQVPYTLATRVNSMLARVAHVLFPTMSGLWAKHDMDGVRTLYFRASRLLFLINYSVGVSLAALAYPLLEHWVNTRYASEGAVALAVFAVAQSINTATMAATYANLGAGRPGVNLAFATVGSVVNLGSVYPLTVALGVSGAALSGLIAALNVPFFLHYGHRHVLEVSSWQVWRRSYQATALGATLVALGAFWLFKPLCTSLPITLVVWCATVVLCMAVSGLLGAVSREDIATARRLLGSAAKILSPAARRNKR